MTKIISQKQTFYKDNAFEVRKVKLELPNGKKITHYIAERVPTVSIFPLTDLYELYLVYQYRYLLKKTILEAVAGRVDKNENFIAAAKRELKEEAGITALQWEQISSVELAASFFRAQTRLFLAKDLEFESPNPEAGEQIEVIKIPLEEAVKKVMNGEIETASAIIGILTLDRLRREEKI